MTRSNVSYKDVSLAFMMGQIDGPMGVASLATELGKPIPLAILNRSIENVRANPANNVSALEAYRDAAHPAEADKRRGRPAASAGTQRAYDVQKMGRSAYVRVPVVALFPNGVPDGARVVVNFGESQILMEVSTGDETIPVADDAAENEAGQ